MEDIKKEYSSSDHETEQPTNVEPETKVVSDDVDNELLTSTIADDLSLSPSPPPTEQDELDKVDGGSPCTVDRKRKYSSDGDDYQSDKDQSDSKDNDKAENVGGEMSKNHLEAEDSVDVKLSDSPKNEKFLDDSNIEKVRTSESPLLESTIADDLSLSPSPPSSPVRQSSTSSKPSISKSLIASSMPSFSLEPSTASRPILSIKLPDVMHSSEPDPQKEQKSVESAQTSSNKVASLNESNNTKSSEENTSRSFIKMDANSDDDREEMDDDDLLKAIGGTSGTVGRKRNTASGGDDHHLDDEDEDSMDDDTLVDGRNRAEDLEFKTSFGLGLFGSSKDSNTNLAERDSKTFTKQEQEKLKEKLQEEERERMQ